MAFGALLAAFLPVLLAISAVAAATGLLAFASRLVPVDDATTSVMLLIGLAVGVDYSLFYVKRAREERAGGCRRRPRSRGGRDLGPLCPRLRADA